MPSPPVTVLMSVYNGERWLFESIQSVIAQNFSDFEFIIVNDGSTDQTLQIAEEHSSRDRRIRVLNKQNTGLADSLNYGIAHARGKWIARIDADDVWESRRLCEQLNFAGSRPSVVLVGSGMRSIDESGIPGRVYLYPEKHSALVRRLTNMKAFFPHSSALIKTDAAQTLGGYKSRVKRAEDFDLWLRLSEIGRVACISQALVGIRTHPNQISHEKDGSQQALDCMLALVSYRLRQMGVIDPTCPDTDQHTFSRFQRHVERYLQDVTFFRQLAFEREIRFTRLPLSANTRQAGILSLADLALKNPMATSKFLLKGIIKSRLSKRIANTWER